MYGGEKEKNRDWKGGPLSIPGNRSGRSIRLSIGLQVCQKERSFCRIESCQGKPQNLSRDKKLGSRAPRGEARRGEWPLPRIDCENVSRGLKRNTAASNQSIPRDAKLGKLWTTPPFRFAPEKFLPIPCISPSFDFSTNPLESRLS